MGCEFCCNCCNDPIGCCRTTPEESIIAQVNGDGDCIDCAFVHGPLTLTYDPNGAYGAGWYVTTTDLCQVDCDVSYTFRVYCSGSNLVVDLVDATNSDYSSFPVRLTQVPGPISYRLEIPTCCGPDGGGITLVLSDPCGIASMWLVKKITGGLRINRKELIRRIAARKRKLRRI